MALGAMSAMSLAKPVIPIVNVCKCCFTNASATILIRYKFQVTILTRERSGNKSEKNVHTVPDRAFFVHTPYQL